MVAATVRIHIRLLMCNYQYEQTFKCCSFSGVSFLFTSADADKLINLETWKDAMVQIYYSLSLQDIALYYIGKNSKKHSWNYYQAALISHLIYTFVLLFLANMLPIAWTIATLDTVLSLLCALTIYAIIGYLVNQGAFPDLQFFQEMAGSLAHGSLLNKILFEFIPMVKITKFNQN